MFYKSAKPWPVLSPYIESIWVQEDHDYTGCEEHPVTNIVPILCTDMAFSYGDSFVEIKDGKEEALSDFHLTGQRTKPVCLRQTGRTGIILVKFYPWGITPFFNIPIHEFTDDVMDVDRLISPSIVSEYKSRIALAPDATEKMNLIQQLLVERLNGKEVDHLIVEAIKRMNNNLGQISIDQLSSDLFISRRQFTRRFLKEVGLTPKKFANIVRFQKALFFQSMGLSTRDIIHHCGYYDQAHMIRQFNTFANSTPEFVASGINSRELMKYFNSRQKLSHLYNTAYM